MMNIIDYIKWRGDLTFEQDPINEVDLAALSMLAYIPYDEFKISINNKKMTLKTIAAQIKKNSESEKIVLGLILSNQILELIEVMSHAKRFSSIILSNYIHQIEMKSKGQDKDTQFCALTADVTGKRIVIFSGTDDTVVGWKEDFTMLSALETPAQKESLAYLSKVSENASSLILTGHSKGGNLSLYCLAKTTNEIYELIESVYNFDGPGLTLEDKDINFVIERMNKYYLYLPQTAIIGELFNQYGNKIITHSYLKGLFQHDLLTWDVLQNRFIHDNKPTTDGAYMNRKIKEIISQLTDEEKGIFLEVLFGLLDATDASTLLELQNKKQKLIKSYINLNPETKKTFNSIINKLILDRVFQKYIFDNIKEYRIVSKDKKVTPKKEKTSIIPIIKQNKTKE